MNNVHQLLWLLRINFFLLGILWKSSDRVQLHYLVHMGTLRCNEQKLEMRHRFLNYSNLYWIQNRKGGTRKWRISNWVAPTYQLTLKYNQSFPNGSPWKSQSDHHYQMPLFSSGSWRIQFLNSHNPNWQFNIQLL